MVGDQRRDLGPGDFVVVRRGAAHALARNGAQLRMLVITSPAGLEQLFVEVVRRQSATGEPIGDEDVLVLAGQFGTRIVGPPIGAL